MQQIYRTRAELDAAYTKGDVGILDYQSLSANFDQQGATSTPKLATPTAAEDFGDRVVASMEAHRGGNGVFIAEAALQRPAHLGGSETSAGNASKATLATPANAQGDLGDKVVAAMERQRGGVTGAREGVFIAPCALEKPKHLQKGEA